jgi:hypothetical protein
MALHLTKEELAEILMNNPDIGIELRDQKEVLQPAVKKESYSKYHNKRTIYNSVMYDSKHEANVARNHDNELRAGTIDFWCRQPEFILPGGIIYRADFIVKTKSGQVIVEDAKGIKTKEYKLKKRQVESIYRVKVIEV